MEKYKTLTASQQRQQPEQNLYQKSKAYIHLRAFELAL